MALAPASSRGADLGQANTWSGNQTAPAFIAAGLTGATAASRYVGATASGAPASGTFSIGDFVIDQSGKLYVCTVAGTPGTWGQVGGSSGVTVVNYTEFTSDVSITGTTAGTATQIVSSGAITYANVLHKVEFYCTAIVLSGTTPFCIVGLWDGASEIGRLTFVSQPTGGQNSYPGYAVRYLTPTAASHTYILKAYKAGTATVSAGDGTGDANAPGFVRITTGS